MNGVIYARYSSDNQREESIEGQIRECSAYAKQHGIVILDTYIDRALSAKTDERPGFQKMIKDSAKRIFDVIIVWKLDRFARNRYDSAHYKMILRKNSVRVLSATEAISAGSEGIILESVLEGMAEYYSVELSEKVKRGQKENALKCKHNGGKMPLGYTLDAERHYVIDPDEAELVREMFTRYADGESVSGMIRDFTLRGIRGKRSDRLSYNTVHNVLNNKKYIGQYSYGDTVVNDGLPAIVSHELFARVQERIAKNRRAPARAKAKEDYLLTTKLFCGRCNSFMVGESGTSKTGAVHHYYKCLSAKRGRGCKKRAIRKEHIEDFVVKYTVEQALTDATIELVANAVIELQGKESSLLPTLRNQLAETERSIENMLNAIQKGVVTASTQERLKKLEAEQESLSVSILQEELSKPLLTKEQIVFWISRFKNMNTDEPDVRRQLIDYFVNAVYLYDDRIVLIYNYKEGTQTIPLAEVEEAFGGNNGSSDLLHAAPPKNKTDATASVLFFEVKQTGDPKLGKAR